MLRAVFASFAQDRTNKSSMYPRAEEEEVGVVEEVEDGGEGGALGESASSVEALRLASFDDEVARSVLEERADPGDDLLGQASPAEVAKEDVLLHAGEGGFRVQGEPDDDVPAPPLILDLGG